LDGFATAYSLHSKGRASARGDAGYAPQPVCRQAAAVRPGDGVLSHGRGDLAVTAYFHLGWWSIIGYAIAAVIAVAGFALAFRDLS
jgi:hypothetical protein